MTADEIRREADVIEVWAKDPPTGKSNMGRALGWLLSSFVESLRVQVLILREQAQMRDDIDALRRRLPMDTFR